ncbi:MAG: hypothetical protein IZT59_07305 [Verrucomicrobia bacterium]|jgi:hypothetical protein|nr:hypothetical protein [Verrucomicrobiota bacterium]|tara:strand:- start:6531 stop:6851 length:321 start_codon:yes stop_codon:yes gene_type:complete
MNADVLLRAIARVEELGRISDLCATAPWKRGSLWKACLINGAKTFSIGLRLRGLDSKSEPMRISFCSERTALLSVKGSNFQVTAFLPTLEWKGNGVLQELGFEENA